VEVKDLSTNVGIRDLGAEFSKYQDLKNLLNVNGLMVVSPTGFTKGALEFAKRHPDVELVKVERPKKRWWVWATIPLLIFLVIVFATYRILM